MGKLHNRALDNGSHVSTRWLLAVGKVHQTFGMAHIPYRVRYNEKVIYCFSERIGFFPQHTWKQIFSKKRYCNRLLPKYGNVSPALLIGHTAGNTSTASILWPCILRARNMPTASSSAWQRSCTTWATPKRNTVPTTMPTSRWQWPATLCNAIVYRHNSKRPSCTRLSRIALAKALRHAV